MPANRTLPLWGGRALAFIGIMLLALNLRAAVTALSPIVSQITQDIPLSSLDLGIIGMLPPVSFAIFGILTPRLTRRVGLETSVVVVCAFMLFGHLVRASAPGVGILWAGSVIAFAGMGAGNVLLPPLVKRYFPDRIGLLTALYAAVLSVSTFLPPLLAAPMAAQAGWRVSLGSWALLALVAALPWLGILVGRRSQAGASGQGRRLVEVPDATEIGRVWHSRIAWALGVVFAMSSLNAYAMFAWIPRLMIDLAQVGVGEAGLMLSLYSVIGLPAALLIPVLAARMQNAAILVYVGVGCWFAGYLALLTVPALLPWLWVTLIGAGPLLFPVVLVLINTRTRTHGMAVQLSAFVQSVGYTLGALGPLLVAMLHEVTGGWQAPIYLLLVSAAVAGVAGFWLTRPILVEDELAARSKRLAQES